MTPLLTGKPIHEHYGYSGGVFNSFEGGPCPWKSISFPGNDNPPCLEVKTCEGGAYIETHYYVGTDWLETNKLAVYVQPKLNSSAFETDYLAMLRGAFSEAINPEELDGLFLMKQDQPRITLAARQDLLTPLLVLQYLQVLKQLVRKGLKKGYYQVTHTMRSRIKGKILVAETIRGPHMKQQTLDTICRFNEFGINTGENRILHKALNFSIKYLHANGWLVQGDEPFTSLIHYSLPALADVSQDASLEEMKHIKLNPFYAEYRFALPLAKAILQRFSFNIQSTAESDTVSVPPFWIDMSKLFELYVLSALRKRYGPDQVVYQFNAGGTKPDFVLLNLCVVADAKYKPKYEAVNILEDIRQLSGYARHRSVLKAFGIDTAKIAHTDIPKCWIIYPYQLGDEDEPTILDLDTAIQMPTYVGFCKSAIMLPIV